MDVAKGMLGLPPDRFGRRDLRVTVETERQAVRYGVSVLPPEMQEEKKSYVCPCAQLRTVPLLDRVGACVPPALEAS